jgi:catechol 2,3-dioxygenase-like lactoylglutathione lyase family enzyme
VPHLHHVNLGVPTDGIDAQASFLTDVLGLRRVDPGPRLSAFGVNWFDDESGIQIHLSADPEHQPAARAHVALSIDDAGPLETRLADGAVDFTTMEFDGLRILFCRDPAGNRWELRCPLS